MRRIVYEPMTPFEQFMFQSLYGSYYIPYISDFYTARLMYNIILEDRDNKFENIKQIIQRKYIKDFTNWYKEYFKYRTYAPKLPMYKFYYG